MVLHLLVKNFGRVEAADIALDNLVVFVGNNNSGKTLIMQLIYGIREELGKFSVPISAGEIRVALEGVESSYFVSSLSECQIGEEGSQKLGVSIDILQYENGETIRSFENQLFEGNCADDAVKEALRMVWKVILSGKTVTDSGQIFLPASRSGLQLL